eukprot:6172822-Pleurochrysis_carterae.AAC.2
MCEPVSHIVGVCFDAGDSSCASGRARARGCTYAARTRVDVRVHVWRVTWGVAARACARARVRARTCACVRVCTCACTRARVRVRVYACACTRARVRMRVRSRARARARACMRAHLRARVSGPRAEAKGDEHTAQRVTSGGRRTSLIEGDRTAGDAKPVREGSCSNRAGSRRAPGAYAAAALRGARVARARACICTGCVLL